MTSIVNNKSKGFKKMYKVNNIKHENYALKSLELIGDKVDLY